MKKKILAMAVVLICVSILASTTLAYFTDMDTARNVITSGGIAVEVVEQQLVAGALQPYPADPIAIMPGATVSKIVSVKNLEQVAWIRASYSITVMDPKGKEKTVAPEELNKVIKIEPDGENWILKDGWLYCAAATATGAVTKPLFEQVRFSGPDMGNEYQNCKIIITVVAQAVQQANNGTTALDAAGWPEV